MGSHDTHTRTQVSFLTLLERYGVGHREEIERLWAAPGTEHLVLFSGPHGADLAILPVGPAHDYRTTEEAFRVNIEGLRASCHTPALGASRRTVEPIPDENWHRWRRAHPAVFSEVDSSNDPLGALIAHLTQKLDEVATRESDIARREKHTEAMEARLDAMAHDHLVRLAEIEQREHETTDKNHDTSRTPGKSRLIDKALRRATGSPSLFIPPSN